MKTSSLRRAIYDAGALVAADRNQRAFWADHRARLEAGLDPAVPAPVVAQVSRSNRQVQLRRLLAGCEVVAFTEDDAHRAGAILAKSRTSHVVDAAVVALAARLDADVVTGDADDIAALAAAAGARVRIFDVAQS